MNLAQASSTADAAPTIKRDRRWPIVRAMFGLTLALATLLLWLQPEALWLKTLAITVLAWWLPGQLLVALWRLPEIDALTALLVALAIGWAWLVGVGLLLHWLPGPVTVNLICAGYGIGGFLLWLALFRRPPAPVQPTPSRVWMQAGLLLIGLLLLWLSTLGAREFFHDEATVLVQARAALRGVADAPARHTKGPGEIIAAMVFYRSLGTTNEFYARLPFALAGIGAVLLMLPLGRRLFSAQVGLWAALLMAVNGYVVALARMTQYQGPLLLLAGATVLSVWCATHRPAAPGKISLAWLWLAVAVTAAGLIMHYEFVLLFPALLAMLIVGSGWRLLTRRQVVATALFALANGFLVAVVYGQMVGSDRFTSSTQFYYAARFLPTPGNNLTEFVNVSLLYNSAYFSVGLLALAAIGLIMAWRSHRRAALLLTLWIVPALVLYLFVITSPGTHYYLIMGALSLLAALPLAWLVGETPALHPVRSGATIALASLWLVVSVAYINQALLQTEPLYLLDFNEQRATYFPTPYDADFASRPRVGVPIQEGWKTLGVLREWGVMDGTYSSNERRTRWYMGDFDRVDVDEQPDYFFIARHVQDPDRAYDHALLDGYQAFGEVRIADQARLLLYRREGWDGVYAVYNGEDFDRAFQEHVVLLGEEPESEPLVQNVVVSPALELVSSGVERATVRRGDVFILENHWRVQEPIGQNLKLFVHFGEAADGAPLAQWDGYPLLNGARTTDWQPGGELVERVPVRIPEEISPGMHPIYLGFYDAATGERYAAGRLLVGEVLVR